MRIRGRGVYAKQNVDYDVYCACWMFWWKRETGMD